MLQNGDPATPIRWREIEYRLETRRHPVFDGLGEKFSGMVLERVHLVVDPVNDFGVLALMRHMIIEDRRRAFRFFGSKYDIFIRRRSASVPSTNPRFSFAQKTNSDMRCKEPTSSLDDIKFDQELKICKPTHSIKANSIRVIQSDSNR